MDYLREGIHLRGFAQIEPLVAYKNEAFELFRDLMNSVWGDFARMIFHVEVTPSRARTGAAAAARAAAPAERRARAHRPAVGNVTYSGGGVAQPSALAMAAAAGAGAAEGYARGGAAAPVEQRRVDETRAARAQRPVLVRVGQEVQEVPRRVSRVSSAVATRSDGT